MEHQVEVTVMQCSHQLGSLDIIGDGYELRMAQNQQKVHNTLHNNGRGIHTASFTSFVRGGGMYFGAVTI